jgi:hypothetical protein
MTAPDIRANVDVIIAEIAKKIHPFLSAAHDKRMSV